ncbi:hypothetical protein CLAVI_000919 [Candidatus Clavichlamydia salmonicola]|uniref:hypothetical protein n=1 Tax=Candidatus Clavichlamydia salmonicola TaxID=469812 RepID=UPI001890D337|nr:hypothetical protein [Candidatus Clavichlamydia salmonicola]MBF5051278.1 hypothetical protein [Candidatus Clavichlamydia salmonicola]
MKLVPDLKLCLEKTYTLPQLLSTYVKNLPRTKAIVISSLTIGIILLLTAAIVLTVNPLLLGVGITLLSSGSACILLGCTALIVSCVKNKSFSPFSKNRLKKNHKQIEFGSREYYYNLVLQQIKDQFANNQIILNKIEC